MRCSMSSSVGSGNGSGQTATPSGFGNVTRFVCEGLAGCGHQVSILGWQTRQPHEWNGCRVHAVGSGVLIACLAEKIKGDEVETLAQGIVDWHKALAPAGDTVCVFRDSAFADDVAKTNLAAILQQHGLTRVRSL